MRKAPDAFRTISEAAELLDTPAHVLRFWESKFPQIKPVKRAGGRRYYRRVDIDLLSGIKLLLHDQGMTIRGVQKLLAEKGPRHVAELAPFAEDVFDGETVEGEDDVAVAVVIEAPPAPLPPEGPANAFDGVGDVPVSRPKPPQPAPVSVVPKAPRPPVHAAQLAHLLRSHPPATLDRRKLGPVTARLEALLARLTAQADRDRAS
jgi:DNA-binding transcriptional MerR regulator